MKAICAIGEALIDFIPQVKGERLKDVVSFKRVAGGAPANVAASVAKLGGHAKFITKLSSDPFGEYILNSMKDSGIDVSAVVRTDDYDTSLAFVSLASDGNRDFKFFRKTAADLQYSTDDIPDDIYVNCGCVHFCSVSLIESPMKLAHKKLIKEAKKQHIPISFDPNLRLTLWNDDEGLKQTVHEFLPYADILKLSDEELTFITGKNTIEDALEDLFACGCTFILYTLGKDGVELYTRDGRKYCASGFNVSVKDTTGAGDSFIGAFLYCILESDKALLDYNDKELKSFLVFANAYAACTTTKEGALSALATRSEFDIFRQTLTV